MAEREGTGTSEIAPPADARLIKSGAPDAASLVMLGIIIFLMLGLLALILRLRYLARHPKREIEDLQTLSQSNGDP